MRPFLISGSGSAVASIARRVVATSSGHDVVGSSRIAVVREYASTSSYRVHTDGDFSRWRPHPWHGLSAGADPPRRVNAFIEITPFDTVKYEIDKASGYLRVDRPQRTSSLPPTLYGFVPRTYCGTRVAALTDGVTDGDGDPLDICVLSERPITRAELVVPCVVVGGIRTTDRDAADDKILAVLENDPFWGEARDIGDVPDALVARLEHYFATYKAEPRRESPARVVATYGAVHAHRVIQAALEDYAGKFGTGD